MIDRTEFESGTFYLGDCFEVMEGLEAGSIDMVVTSPPYDDLRTYNDVGTWNLEKFKDVASGITRLVKGGSIIVWIVNDATIGGSETGTSFRQALFFKDECKLNLHDTMIYQRIGASSSGGNRYIQCFEYMFVFSKGKPKTFNPLFDRENKTWKTTGKYETKISTRNKNGIATEKKSTKTKQFGSRFNIWQYSPALIRWQKTRGGFDHPAMFCIEMPQDHIVSWSNKGDIVLDPFAGSGTTAIAAMNAGRRWICIEKDETYYRAAVERVRQHEAKMKEAA